LKIAESSKFAPAMKTSAFGTATRVISANSQEWGRLPRRATCWV
jgi:hypothetical protein